MYAPAWRARAASPRAALLDLEAALAGAAAAPRGALKVVEAETPDGWCAASERGTVGAGRVEAVARALWRVVACTGLGVAHTLARPSDSFFDPFAAR